MRLGSRNSRQGDRRNRQKFLKRPGVEPVFSEKAASCERLQMLRVVDCGARVLISQLPERQGIKNQIDTAMIFASANFVSAHHLNRRKPLF